MKVHLWILITCLVVAIGIMMSVDRSRGNVEAFEVVPSMDFYVITMGQADRRTNIRRQIETQLREMPVADRFDFTIHDVDAVVGKNLDLDDLIAEGRLFDGIYTNPDKRFNEKMANRYNEVGCYLSHYKTYETIREQGRPNGYSVIFEDDFVLDPQFLAILDKTMIDIQANAMDFDMLFLGITGDVGEKMAVDHVYRTTGVSWCAHGYLVNNRHINKILDKMWYIHNILDVQIFKNGNKGELNILRLHPTIVEQGEMGTTIRNHM